MRIGRSVAGALLGLGLLLSAGSGCGPIEATAVINNAEIALAGARTARAEEHAPYEYVTAELFLEKAREERGYAHFGRAIRYGRKAAQSAREAQAHAQQRVRAEGASADRSGSSRSR